MRHKAPIDWVKIEALMLKSFVGQGLTEAEQTLVMEAHKREPGEYGRRNQAVKNAEIEARKRMFQ